MIIPINVPDTAKVVYVRVEYVGSLGTDLNRVMTIEGEELDRYREEAEADA